MTYIYLLVFFLVCCWIANTNREIRQAREEQERARQMKRG